MQNNTVIQFLLAVAVLTGIPAHAQQPAAPSPPKILSAAPLESMNSAFQQKDGWIGGDGAQSVLLPHGKTLWLFSDTWVGKIAEGKRTGATIVNNTLAIQSGTANEPKVDFFIKKNEAGAATAWTIPADGRGWFWLGAGIVDEGRLHLFLTQIEKTSDPGVFGFKQMGQWLGVVEHPGAAMGDWKVAQSKLPHTHYSSEREITFGAAVLKHGEHIYLYGTDEDVKPRHRERYLLVARAPVGKLAKFDAWEFFAEGAWQSDFRKATRVVPNMASDGSVSYLPDRKEFLLVYTEGGLSKKILARAAKNPWGPWSEPTTIYECPEMAKDRRIFCYNARAHASLSSGDELVVSYADNSMDFWHVAADASVYWTRFVRVKLAPKDSGGSAATATESK